MRFSMYPRVADEEHEPGGSHAFATGGYS